MTQAIEIIIAPDGRTKLETKGFAGQSCRSASVPRRGFGLSGQ
jgi:hypothetical protein